MKTLFHNLPIFAFVLLSLNTAHAQIISINFDVDASGNPITAPAIFNQTVALTNLYAPLGVSFSGPGGNDGGAIVNQNGGFGINARSGTNFLAFNPLVPSYGDFTDGGIPTDPETITFNNLMSTVSIYAAGGESVKTFLMQGYDASGTLVASDTISTDVYSLLLVSSSLGIKSVKLHVTSPLSSGTSGFVYDDLVATGAPEASTWAMLLSGLGLLAFWRGRSIARESLLMTAK